MANFIKNRSTKYNLVNDITQLKQATWHFISIYKVGQNSLKTDDDRIFKQNMLSKFTPKSNINKLVKKAESSKDKQAEVIKLLLSILTRPSKKVLQKSKFFEKDNIAKGSAKPKNKQSYTQALAPKVNDILKLKENFLNLLAKKIENIYRIINDFKQIKPRINMTTKSSSRKQIIIPIGNYNKSKFIASLNLYITNLNSTLRNIKSEVIANFIQAN